MNHHFTYNFPLPIMLYVFTHLYSGTQMPQMKGMRDPPLTSPRHLNNKSHECEVNLHCLLWEMRTDQHAMVQGARL